VGSAYDRVSHQQANEESLVRGSGYQCEPIEIREVGKGYTLIGTKYTYNSRNQLVHREDLIRDEEYDYTYDEAGNLLSDGRSEYEWNARGQLTKVTFPDGFGETYTYDMLGRRVSKTQFNHRGETQQTTVYHYKSDTWVLTEEVVSGDGDDGESTKSYTYDANDRPLTITFKGETFWYVYNGHGDVMALTDKDGNVAARYEYDAWGLVTRMYNRYGERIREGIGWIGDLGTGNGSPGSAQGPDGGGNGNTTPDYHPGNGSTPDQSSATVSPTETGSTSTGELTLSDIVTTETEPTDDITTELVKENPIRYAGYYWDRKTQFYYLQARYYDPRPARFISEDSYEGEIEDPLTLDLYSYVENNPLTYDDPSGHASEYIDDNGEFQRDLPATDTFDSQLKKFPQSYKVALQNLHTRHPKWQFIAYDTNIVFSKLVDIEMKEGAVVSNVEQYQRKPLSPERDRGNFRDASRDAAGYFVNTLNFLNETQIFQFMSARYNATSQSLDAVRRVLTRTELENKANL